ncbi:hypothetical protein TELCIR_09784 [Teladorsagia circumcincta]|uniref:Uncharacterized protein n=1 Tax=Teladorsagia circumcincta TaxID=45464 RepID=A0A2G9UDV8_TELCI|nr:hypothetical protein TELCIR_09784 [Teladorsagia circumcincta]
MKLIKSKFPRDTQLEVNKLEHRSGKKWTLPDLLDGLNEVIEEFEKLEDYCLPLPDHLRQNPVTTPTSVASVVPLTTSPPAVITVCLLRIAASSSQHTTCVGSASTKDMLAVNVDIPSVAAALVITISFCVAREILVRRLRRITYALVIVRLRQTLRAATVNLEVHPMNVPVTHHVHRLDPIPTVALHRHREDLIDLEDLIDHEVWTTTYVSGHPFVTVPRQFALSQGQLTIPEDKQHQSTPSYNPRTIRNQSSE